MTQVHPTEKPSIYVILACMAIGVTLLTYFFNPYNQITSPLPPQPVSSLTNDTIPGLPDVPRSIANTPVLTNSDAAPITAPESVPPPAQAELAPAQRAPMSSANTNAAPASGETK